MDLKTFEYVISVSLLLIVIYIIIRYWPKQQNLQTVGYESEYMKCESPIERRLYNGLTQHNLFPISQYQEGPYRIDLAFPIARIAIEADGKAYHSSPEQKAHDRKKNAYLKRKGWTVLRFSGSRIHRDLPGVVKKIKEHL